MDTLLQCLHLKPSAAAVMWRRMAAISWGDADARGHQHHSARRSPRSAVVVAPHEPNPTAVCPCVPSVLPWPARLGPCSCFAQKQQALHSEQPQQR